MVFYVIPRSIPDPFHNFMDPAELYGSNRIWIQDTASTGLRFLAQNFFWISKQNWYIFRVFFSEFEKWLYRIIYQKFGLLLYEIFIKICEPKKDKLRTNNSPETWENQTVTCIFPPSPGGGGDMQHYTPLLRGGVTVLNIKIL